MSDTLPSENLVIDDGSSDTGRQRQLLLLVGGLALLLVAGLGVYFLVLSGGEEEDLGVVPGAAAPQADAGDENGNSDKNKKKKNKELAPTNVNANFTVGRDPFEPLAGEALVAPEPTADSSTTDTTTTGTGQGSVAPAPAPTTAPQPTPTQDTQTSYKVTLLSVDLKQKTAVIEVNGKRYPVKVKDMFTNTKTGPFKLTGVGKLGSGKEIATVVFGSDSPVELLVNEKVVFKP